MGRLTNMNNNNKFKMAAIPFIAHNLVAIAHTCTKFHMRAKFDVLLVVTIKSNKNEI